MIYFFILTGGVHAVRNLQFYEPPAASLLPRGYPVLMKWIHVNIQTQGYIFGPTHTYPTVYSADRIPLKTHFEMPDVRTIEELNLHISRHRIRYVVLDSFLFKRRKVLLGDYFTFNPEYGLQTTRKISGWKEVFSDPSSSPDYLVFSVSVSKPD